MGVFDYDGGIMRSLCKFSDCIFLSLMFVVCCIPVVTIGTAATAMYYTAHKVLRQDRGYIFRDYIESFQANFKQTTPIWLLTLILGGILGIDWYVMGLFGFKGIGTNILGPIFITGTLLLNTWISYLFPYMARFENTTRQSMKNAALMALRHLPTTILMMIVEAVVLAILWFMPLLLAILPAFYAWIQSYFLERVLRKYMSTEDLEREEELEQ